MGHDSTRARWLAGLRRRGTSWRAQITGLLLVAACSTDDIGSRPTTAASATSTQAASTDGASAKLTAGVADGGQSGGGGGAQQTSTAGSITTESSAGDSLSSDADPTVQSSGEGSSTVSTSSATAGEVSTDDGDPSGGGDDRPGSADDDGGSDGSTCRPCEGEVTALSLSYRGHRRARMRAQLPDGTVVFDDEISPDERIDLRGAAARASLGPTLEFFVDDLAHGRLRTDCVEAIGPGTVVGLFTVLAGASDDGGRLCPVVPTDECGPCEGNATALVLRYEGKTLQRLRITQDGGPVIFDAWVLPGSIVAIRGRHEDHGFGRGVDLRLGHELAIRIPTSCSEELLRGMVFGDLVIVDGHSRQGGRLCDADDCALDDVTCDGVDDDCNGIVDDGYRPRASECGVGACAATGQMECRNGREIDSCRPGTPQSDDRVCDGIDADCNGLVDDDFEPSCGARGPITCVDGAIVESSCDDGNLCNGVETCRNAACRPGVAPPLDDGNPCTHDRCDPLKGVSHDPVPDGRACSDGDVCNGRETCGSGRCRAGTPLELDDGNPCTRDICNPSTGVQHPPWPAGHRCRDDDRCNGDESCDGAGRCQPGVAPILDDDNPCTLDTCDPSTGVQHDPAPLGSDCRDGDLCNGHERCDAGGSCQPGVAPEIDDGDPCTLDSCDPKSGVEHELRPAGSDCGDGDLCNGREQCLADGRCKSGAPPVVDDGNPCTRDFCDPQAGVIHETLPDTTPCGPGSICQSRVCVLVNRAPVIEPVGRVFAYAARRLEVPLVATDPNDDPLAWSGADGLDFVSLVDRGDGTATLVIEASDDHDGPHEVQVSVSDGLASDAVTVHIRVIGGPPVAIGPSVSVDNRGNPGGYFPDPSARVVFGLDLSVENQAVPVSRVAFGPTVSVHNIWAHNDLSILAFDTRRLEFDPQSLAFSGVIAARIRNRGGPVTQPFDLVFFRDVDNDGRYDTNVDDLLALVPVDDAFDADDELDVPARIAGQASFAGEPIWAMVDAGNTVREFDETNNVFHTGSLATQTPPDPSFDPEVELHFEDPECPNVDGTPVVIDLDRDGMPEIVFTTACDAPWTRAPAKLRAIHGDGSGELWAVDDPALGLESHAGLAAGDIDLDGLPEIIGVLDDTGDLVAFESDGTHAWTTSVNWTKMPNPCWAWDQICIFSGGAPSLAQFDDDPFPEVIAGSAVLNHDGTILWEFERTIRGNNGFGSVALTVDLDLDGRQELVGGSVSYRQDGTVYWDVPWLGSLPDGVTAVGNFDDDLNPEIVLVSGGQVRLLDDTREVIWGPVGIPGGGKGGPPSIADIDHDGHPEILVVGMSRLVAFEHDGTIKWERVVLENGAAMTGTTVFDFEHDGVSEVIHGDIEALRVFAGTNGEVLFEYPRTNITAHEYPVIADVDADGRAELLVTANSISVGDGGGLTVLGDPSWVGTRPIWNQHAYHIDNIADDGSIPTTEATGWLTHNTYRLNVQPEHPLVAVDLVPSQLTAELASGRTLAMARIGNAGAADAPAGVRVAFYSDDPSSGGQHLGTVATTRALSPGQFEAVSLSLAGERTRLWVQADDDGTGTGTVAESDETNNGYAFANHAPTITSTPTTQILAGATYQYRVTAIDSDPGDVIRYRLLRGPPGMTIDELGGLVDWMTTPADRGEHPVTVAAVDGHGWSTTQSYVVQVDDDDLNYAPVLATIPDVGLETGDILDVIFQYYDPNGDFVDLRVEGLPEFGALFVDPADDWATITFTPPLGLQGSFEMEVVASDGELEAREPFALTVGPRNQAPVITSRPPPAEGLGVPYLYLVEANDPDGDALEYSLTTAPIGMRIDAVTGRIEWTPASGQIGDHPVDIRVRDHRGLSARQSFVLSVADPLPNRAPEFESEPSYSVGADQAYLYPILASDPDGDDRALRYELETGPEGMTLSEDGRLEWPADGPRPERVEVRVVVRDPGGASATQRWEVQVVPVGPPQIAVAISSNLVAVGEIVDMQVQASASATITALALRVGDEPVELDGDGVGEFVADEAGFFEVHAEVTDELGQTATATRRLIVGDPSDDRYPRIELEAFGGDCFDASDRFALTGRIEDDSPFVYELRMRERGQLRWIPFARGEGGPDEPVVGTVATFDPTVLRNGVHELMARATDSGGNISTLRGCAVVRDELKLGQFNFASTDLSLPGLGMPLSVVREYDSRAQGSGDFGPGWTLANRSVSVSTPGELGQGWTQEVAGGSFLQYIIVPTQRHEVVIRFSDDDVACFELEVEPRAQFFDPLEFLTVKYVAIKGTQGRLEAVDVPNEVILQQPFLTTYGADIYAPRRFRLTRRDGSVYVVSMDAGIESVTDLDGHTITYGDDGIHHSGGASVSFERGVGGRIERIVDRFGTEYEYSYGADGYLERVVQIGLSQGQAVERVMASYGYGHVPLANSLNRNLETIVAPDGTEIGPIKFTDEGRVASVPDAEGNTVLFGYDLEQHLHTVTDRLGHPTTYEYDGRGNVTRKLDALGHETLWAYDEHGNEIEEVFWRDGVPVKTVRTFNEAGDMLAERDAEERLTEYKYDAAGRLLKVWDPMLNETEHIYDAKGHLRRTIDAHGNTSAQYSYDAQGNMATSTDINGIVRRYAYDEHGNQVGSSVDWVNPDDPSDRRTLTTSSTYDDYGRPLTTIDAHGRRTTNEYDPLTGSLLKTTHDDGRHRSNRYDALGRVIESWSSDGTKSFTVYDAQGKVWVQTDRFVRGGALPRGRRMSYDVEGRVVKTERLADVDILVEGLESRVVSVGAVLSTTESSYDELGRLATTLDARGALTVYEYNEAGDRRAVTNALGERTEFEYGRTGRQLRIRDALGRVTAFAYDILGRRTTTTFADGTSTRAEYDVLGRRIAEIDQGNSRRDFEFDAAGRLLAVTLAAVVDHENGGLQTRPRYEYRYADTGTLLAIRDAKGRETRFTYDPHGQRRSRTLPLGQSEFSEYGDDGLLRRQTDFNGQITEFVHDEQDRVIEKRLYAVGDNAPTMTIGFGYDELGRQVSITEDRGDTTKTYDPDGNVTMVASPEGTIRYDYDPATGDRVRTYTEFTDTRYGYDLLGRLETVSSVMRNGEVLPEPEVTRYSYDAVGSKDVTTLPNGVRSQHGYDPLGRLISLEHVNAADELLASYGYALHQDGRRHTVDEAHLEPGATDPTLGRVQYQYDGLKRLRWERLNDEAGVRRHENAYRYDLVGNRLRRQVDTLRSWAITTYEYDDNDRLLREVHDVQRGAEEPGDIPIERWATEGETTYTYDANGATIGKVTVGERPETVVYGYNLEGRLATSESTTMVGGVERVVRTWHVYDQEGIRVRKEREVVEDGVVVDDGVEVFLVDGLNPTGYQQVLEVRDSDATVLLSYRIGDDVVSDHVRGDPTGSRFFLYDAHGSVRGLATYAQSVGATHRFEGYGVILETSEVPGHAWNPLKAAGEYFDPDLGANYLRARYYDAHLGRFSRADEFEGVLSDPQSTHRYGYGEADPVNRIDPSGNVSLLEIAVVNKIRGLLVSATVGAGMRVYGEAIYSGDGFSTLGLAWNSRDAEAAEASYEVYSPHNDGAGLRDLIDYQRYAKRGFQAMLFRGASGQPYLAFRGTELDREPFLDLAASIDQLLTMTGPPSQYVSAIRVAVAVAAKVPDVVITGHSLGGGLASAASCVTGIETITFNAAGLSPAWGCQELSYVRSHYIIGDPLTEANKFLLPTASGQLFGHKPRANMRGVLDRHSIRNFVGRPVL